MRALLIVALFLMGTPLIAGAQGIVQQSFEFQITPKNPQPGEVVRVEAETYSFDVQRAAVVWKVNGTTVREGKGIREIQVEAGQFGSPITVSFSANLNGQTISETTQILPAVVDLIVEPQTYVPEGYKGKALPVHESQLRIVAIPTFIGSNGVRYSEGDIIFTWRDGVQVNQAASGLGKNVFLVDGPPRSREKEIRLDLETTDGAFVYSAFVTILPAQPEVVLYLINPLMGLELNRALSESIELPEEEITLSAEPYYFHGNTRGNADVRYEWRLNRSDIVSGNEDSGTLTLRRAGEGRGRANVVSEVSDPGEPLLGANTGISITFGIENTGIFGF